MAYTTLTKVNSLFGISMTQTVFDDLLASVKSFIDRYCGKTFEGASETRYYDGNGGTVLNIDSFYGTATVLILNLDGSTQFTLTEGQANDFITAPYNSTEKNQLVLVPGNRIGTFPKRFRSVKVTATFGFSSSVPADIELVATKMIGEVYNDSITGASGATVAETLGDYSIRYSEKDINSAIGKASEKVSAPNVLDLYRDIDV